MSRLSPREEDALQQFLRTLRFRHVSSERTYACKLRKLQRFLLSRANDRLVTQDLIQQWLRLLAERLSVRDICQHARCADHFLNWVKEHGGLSDNPFSTWRQQYGRRIGPIVRALLSEDSAVALNQLCRSPQYGSVLGPLMRQHVERMRALGYRFDRMENALLRFDRFLQHRADLPDAPLHALLEVWRGSEPTPRQRLEVNLVGRSLTKALHRHNDGVEVLPADRDAARRVKQIQRRPHIYSEAQIVHLLEVTVTFEFHGAPLRARSLHMMVLLIYCAGLRVGELARLTLADLDLVDNILEVRGTKFFKTRRLPLSTSVAAAIRQYLTARQQAGAPIDPENGLFWKDIGGGCYSYGGIRNLLVEALRRAGLKPAHGKIGPRIHDLRHAMVCHRMEAWYREGINPQSRLPYLAAYLGHKDINSTLVYLTVTQEQMWLASERFRVCGVAVLGPMEKWS